MFVNPEHPDVKSGEFKMAVSLGLVPGWRQFRKFGVNPSVVSGTQEMWPLGTPRVLPTGAVVAMVTSTSIQDDIVGITGTGAWTIQVEGLDADGNEVSDTVNMRGTVPAFTTQAFLRVNRAYVLTPGTSETNVGNISVSIFGAVQAYIPAGLGQTLQTQYSVPAGHTVLVLSYSIGTGRAGGNNDTHIASQILTPGGAWRTQSDIYLWETTYSEEAAIYVLPERAEVKQLIISTTTGQASCIYSGFIVDNSFLPAGWLLDA